MDPDQELDELVAEILASKKYRDMHLCPDTVRDILARELAAFKNRKEGLKAVRQKLHNVVAPYLGDPDYPAALRTLQTAFAGDDPAVIRAACAEILTAHASTKERLSILDGFYASLFSVTGVPTALMDVACGLNPLTFPWMGLDPTTTHYYAYDLHGPRVEFLNGYFRLQGLPPLAIAQDILVRPPDQPADVALFFKEAHRFEQRQRGSTALLVDALPVRWVLVSLPTHSLTGRFDLMDRQRQLITHALADRSWPVTELVFENEMVFCIDKGAVASAELAGGEEA